MCICPIDAWRLTEDFEDVMTSDLRASYILPQITQNWLPKLLFANNIRKIPYWLKGYYEHVVIPCGKCIECKLKHSKMWSLRCVHEAQYHRDSCFLTVTYNEDSVPLNNGVRTLCYSDIQKFLKLLRKYINNSKIRYFRLHNIPYDKDKDYVKIRYFCSSEYGTQGTIRPHYHLIIFGWCPRPKQLVLWNYGKSGMPNYRCFALERFCWKNKDNKSKGMIVVGSATRQSAGYIARYTLEKAYVRPDDFYKFREKEGIRMSRRNGLGENYIKENFDNVFRLGFINLCEGNKIFRYAIPRFYKKWLQKNFPERYELLKAYFKQKALECEEMFHDFVKTLSVPIYKVLMNKHLYYKHIVTKLKRNFASDFLSSCKINS